MKRIKCLVRTNFIGNTFIYPTYRQNISSNNPIVVPIIYLMLKYLHFTSHYLTI